MADEGTPPVPNPFDDSFTDDDLREAMKARMGLSDSPADEDEPDDEFDDDLEPDDDLEIDELDPDRLIDITPEQLSLTLVNRYLDIKESGQL